METPELSKEMLDQVNDILDEAIRQIRHNPYGGYLLDKYPIRRTSEREYPDANAVLREVGSPAMTDGKDVYVDATILGKMLSQNYPDLINTGECRGYEDYWTKTKLSEAATNRIGSSRAIDETMDIIYHELTHALNQHTKISAAAEARGATAEYMAKLAVACELQANDGVAGRRYAFNLLQRQKGVTNKRLHPETHGCHTLREFMAKLQLNEQEQQNAQSKATAQNMNNNVRMAKATGEYKKQLDEAKAKQQQTTKDAQDGSPTQKVTRRPGCGDPSKDLDELDDMQSNEKITNELEKAGLAAVKKLLLEALSDQLRYDPNSDSVFFDETIRRVPRRTYARPSRKMTAGNPIIKKGTVYDRIHEPNKANKLTVLAVDASGSMRSQQGYVSAILDDLLKQAEAVAREHKLEVHYENLLCTLHRRTATKLVPATSEAWKEAMRNYHANGDNEFDCIMHAIKPAVRERNYDGICVINLSDGFDYLSDTDSWGSDIRSYIANGKLNWVDALISYDVGGITRAKEYAEGDAIDIRKQVVLNVHHKDY